VETTFLSDDLHNSNIIRRLQCTDEQCTGSALIEKSSIVKSNYVYSWYESKFSIQKKSNPALYKTLKRFYDSSTKIDETVEPESVNLVTAVSGGALAVGFGFAAAMLMK